MDIEKLNQTPPPHAHKILWAVIGVLFLVVILGSVVWWQEIKKQTVSSKQETEIQNLTADWKTYNNTEHFFEFKLPPQYINYQENGIDYFEDTTSKLRFNISLQENNFNYSSMEYVKAAIPDYGVQSGKFKSLQSANTTGVETILESGSIKTGSVYFASKTGVVNFQYPLDSAYYDEKGVSAQQKTDFLNKVRTSILTFEFVDQSKSSIDLSAWKTYTNTEYGFELQYPTSLFEDGVLKNESNGAKALYLASNENLETITILPDGKFDYGFPTETPKVEQITVGGKKAQQSTWHIQDNQTFKLIEFSEDIKGWSKDSRIQLRSLKEEKLLDQVIATLKFTK